MNSTTSVTFDGSLFHVTIKGISFAFSRQELRDLVRDLQWGDLGNDPDFEIWLEQQEKRQNVILQKDKLIRKEVKKNVSK